MTDTNLTLNGESLGEFLTVARDWYDELVRRPEWPEEERDLYDAARRLFEPAEPGSRCVVPGPCPKCGGAARTVYHGGNYGSFANSRCGLSDYAHPPGEHLHYRCQTCQFDWAGAVLP